MLHEYKIQIRELDPWYRADRHAWCASVFYRDSTMPPVATETFDSEAKAKSWAERWIRNMLDGEKRKAEHDAGLNLKPLYYYDYPA